MNQPKRLLVLLLSCLALTACETGVSWSDQEKENARHIIESMQAARRAAETANQLPARWEPGDESVEPVIESLDEALGHVAQVRESVLIKAHPRLPGRFRSEFRESLRQLRSYYRTGEMDEGADPRNTLGEFTEWFYRNQHEFRWWRGFREDMGLE